MSKKVCSIAPKTRKQIAEEFGINYKTLMSRLKRKSVELPSGVLLGIHQKIIYDQFGYPNETVRIQFEGK
ncbi:MAG: hypothetical protein AAGI23_22295 [Bacteroidota bacterium]